MADGHDPAAGYVSFRKTLPWVELFRTFQVALDPRKLLVAAAGILAMSFGWWLLSVMFYEKEPDRNAERYSAAAVQRDLGKTNPATGKEYTNDELAAATRAEADRRYAADFQQWQILADLAGPGGRLRTMPWYEYRGPNPFLFVTHLLSSPSALWWGEVRRYLAEVTPVLLEPLVKLLLPIAKLIGPGVSPGTRFYLFLVIMWNLAVWAFCGGVITRLAAVQLANKGPITFRQAVRFVATRYVNYLLSPLIPLAIIGAVVLGLIVYGLLSMIPILGDVVLLGLGLPLVIAAGAVMAVFLVGLIGYPLMYTTLSVEGDSSDTFDALSRSINYVYQSPWNYLWYWLVAILYGAAVTFFVLFFSSLMVYVGKWAVSQAPWSEAADRKPDFLFIYAPESFGWRELLTADSPYAVVPTVTEPPGGGRKVVTYVPKDPPLYNQKRAEFYVYNTWGAGLVCFWLTLLFLMMLGFSYSFFWSAATVIYYLMRKKVDEAELDEVYVEEDEPEAPVAPPKIAEGTVPASAAPPGGASLPVLNTPPAPPPVAVSPPPVTLTSPPPPPASTLPFNPTSTSPPTPPPPGTGAGPTDKPTV